MPETGHKTARPTLIQTGFNRVIQPIEEIHEFEAAILQSGRWDAVRGLPRLPWFKASARLVSLAASADRLNAAGLPGFAAHWVPEAVDAEVHRRKNWMERTTAVLQLGRRWDAYHTAIEPFCRAAGHGYLYETEPGRIIYPTRTEFLDGLADARISICVPSSLTHPARSGCIETMTWRYLQSIRLQGGCKGQAIYQRAR